MSGNTGFKPGAVHWVVGVKNAYRAATGKQTFNSKEARRRLNARGVTTFRLEHPVDDMAIDREDPT